MKLKTLLKRIPKELKFIFSEGLVRLLVLWCIMGTILCIVQH